MADKTFSEMMHEQMAAEQAKRAQKREQQRNEFLNGLRSELEGYQTKALETAKTRELGNLRNQLNSGSLDEEQKAEVQEKILNPSLITVTATEADYGTNYPRVKELLDMIANPEKTKQQQEQADFIAKMKGYSERHGNGNN